MKTEIEEARIALKDTQQDPKVKAVFSLLEEEIAKATTVAADFRVHAQPGGGGAHAAGSMAALLDLRDKLKQLQGGKEGV